jgi:FkbM family methyltransferase
MIDFTEIKKTLNKNKKIILWGAGPNVEKFINDYAVDRKFFNKPIGIIETRRNINIGDEFLKGLPFMSMDDVISIGYDNCIIIITAGLLDLYSDIIKNELFYYKIIHKKSIEYYDYYLNNNIDFQKNISFLNDDQSKKIFAERLQNILDGNFINPSLSTPPYFLNDIIGSPSQQKINNFLYAGAFNGKHVDRFLINNPKGKVCAFEPSINMFQYLKKKYQNNNSVILFNNLLWNNNDKIRFNDDYASGGLSASIFNPESLGNTYLVDGFRIDELVDKFRADLVALDVEGSELNALKGAKNYFEKYLPVIAICIYHNASDYHKILEYMINNFSNKYNFFIRQHSIICYIETVLYCMPK